MTFPVKPVGATTPLPHAKNEKWLLGSDGIAATSRSKCCCIFQFNFLYCLLQSRPYTTIFSHALSLLHSRLNTKPYTTVLRNNILKLSFANFGLPLYTQIKKI